MNKQKITDGFKMAILSVLLMITATVAVSCDSQDGQEEKETVPKTSLNDFPILDSSTSTQPLMVILAAKVLGLPYKWWQDQAVTQVWYVAIDWQKTSLTETQQAALQKKLNSSTTHGSYMNLLDGKAELIVASRNISRDEQKYADGKGVKLITRPVAKDGFVFIVNKNNPVTSLSTQQIQDIYTGKTENWKEVGGNDATIHPYIRNANSGSQEKMETMVMKGLTIVGRPGMETGTMAGPFYEIRRDADGIAYTPFYYYNIMTRGQDYAKTIGVEGVMPDKQTINDGTYPYVSEIFASVRADVDHNSQAYKLFQYLTQLGAQSVIEESGYIPLSQTARK
ncbi:PstS family phosphate ABC transporter substrate-binding protein [Prevotella sp. kh1p2]|uniref:PstS family phosphate ABC transporter substrate-binding protein n=1 Tax=Prevotella sp. kh1p2 TaxID=1761883 RepID=UPI0008C136BE|nr:substrate-binding domain-containing protein [Prevotella sp. kh1p2]SET20823.1 phosphate transport system substrate-binding protein [Prevotella sp. kh1p2]SNU12246.1 phosphate transport system substrate-binding protein [Prevotellaceae bacterium KH2P17]